MLIQKLKVALSILTRKVLTGPIEVSVDLTCQCTTGCVMCWYWSPLLKDRPSGEWSNQSLKYEVLERLLADFKKLKVKRIILGGQGDPLLYPKILEAIRMAKQMGIEVCLITGGVYLNEERTRKIFELGVDHLDISLQAATPQTYQKIHPLQKEGTFERIKGQLMLLSRLKKESRKERPQVRIIQVVFNLNYQETVKIVELAKEINAQSVGLKRIDVIPETRDLLLNKGQLEQLKILLNEAEARAKELGVKTEIGDFRKYMLAGLNTGIYTADFYARIPCYVGWHSSRILANGDVVPCCNCYSLIFGNINKTSFCDIWSSKEYQQFRLEALKINKDFLSKRGCKCYSCNDFGSNLAIYRKLNFFRRGE